jgi:hypothetical protein
MASFNKIVLEFNSLLSQQKYMEALDFYDSEIVSTDNLNPPVIGISFVPTELPAGNSVDSEQ